MEMPHRSASAALSLQRVSFKVFPKKKEKAKWRVKINSKKAVVSQWY